MNFFNKFNTAISQNQSLLFVGLDPNLEMLPSRFCQHNSNIDNLWDWLQYQIAQTADLVCAYKPTFGFYKALGAPGMELLHNTLKAIPSNIPIILDAKTATSTLALFLLELSLKIGK